jgi:hypothetical protein
LRALLAKTTKSKLELSIALGESEFPCRLVAIKLDEESYQKRLKNLEEKRRKDPRLKDNPSDVLNGWTIFVTNLPASVMPNNLLIIYSIRWQIELLFKTMKTFLHFREITDTNPKRSMVCLCLSMIAIVLLSLVVLTIQHEEISLYKACKIFAKNIRNFMGRLNDRTECAISWMGGLMAQFALKESRAKRPSTKKILNLKPLKRLS